MTRSDDKRMERKMNRKALKEARKRERQDQHENKKHDKKWLYKHNDGWAIKNKVKVTKKFIIGTSIFIAIVLLFWGLGTYQWPEADGATLKPMMAIYRSNSCVVSYEAGGGCIDNRYLVESYDNTNHMWSGRFKEVNGDLERTAPQYKEHWMRYQYTDKKMLVAVDPDGEWINHGATFQIVIEPINYTYIETRKNTNGTISYHDKVFISGCSFARVAADKELIHEVIMYFYNWCSGTKPESKTTVIIPQTPIVYMDYTEYRYQKWLTESKLKCKGLCFEYTKPPQTDIPERQHYVINLVE